MGFFKDIADSLINDDTLRDLDREQSEAMIDAMMLLVYADGEESFLESHELDHLLHELPWSLREGDAVDVYRDKSAACMKEAALRGAQGFEEAAQGIAARLTSIELRKKALRMAAAAAYADWGAGEEEHEALMKLAEAFEIPAPFAQAIIHDTGVEATEASTQETSLDEEDTEPEHIPAPANQTIREVLSQDFLEGFFNDLFDDDELRHLDEEGAYAFVDALSLALVADGYPTHEELQEFKAQLENLPFASEDAEYVKERVEAVINTLREADEEGTTEYIRDVGAKIESETLREAALRMAITITHADFDISSQENRVIAQMAEAFGVSEDRLAQLLAEAEERGEDTLFE